MNMTIRHKISCYMILKMFLAFVHSKDVERERERERDNDREGTGAVGLRQSDLVDEDGPDAHRTRPCGLHHPHGAQY